MASLSPSNPSPTSMPVPLLDVQRENSQLRHAIDAAIGRVCDAGAFIQGPSCRELEQALADYCSTDHAIGCASGSDALLLALMALDIGEGDEVLLPSFTFFATAGAVWRLGAKPVFVDIDPATFNIDPHALEAKITPKTRMILVVHLFGQCADMAAICEIAAKHGILVVEDAAQAIGAEYRGRRAGSLGVMGCFSFYPTKNLGGFGDGGMITLNDGELADRLRILRDHGQHPRYHHHYVGINSRLDSIQAAVLGVKLSQLDDLAAAREINAKRYFERLAGSEFHDRIALPGVGDGCRSVWNQFTVRVTDGYRDRLKKFLDDRHIGTAIYYPVPLHRQKCFASLGYPPGSLPETERAADEVLSLPIFPGLTDLEHATVTDAIRTFCVNHCRGQAA